MTPRVLRPTANALLIVLISITIMFPLAWMAIAGFKGRTEVLRSPFQFFPDMWSFDNYSRILQDPEFMRAMGITFVGAVIFTALSLAVNSLAAYAFARLDFPLKKIWFAVMLGSIMLPHHVTVVPQYIVFAELDWINTIWPLIVPTGHLLVGQAAVRFCLRGRSRPDLPY